MSDELLTALENKRRYVAQELHDGLAQSTLQLGLQARICSKLLEQNNRPPAEREVLGGPPEGGTGVGKPRWG